jgi:hypothetical protein
MKWLLTLPLIVMIAGCGDVRPNVVLPHAGNSVVDIKPSTEAKTAAVNDAITESRKQQADAAQKQHEAEQRAAIAIKTSQDAEAVIQQLKAANEQDKKDIRDRESQIKALQAEESDLRKAEIAKIISITSWVVCAIGVITTLIGGYIFWRGLFTAAKTLFFGGLGTIAMGVIGLLIAPAWVLFSWIFGAAIFLLGIVVLIMQIEDHKSQVNALVEKLKAL